MTFQHCVLQSLVLVYTLLRVSEGELYHIVPSHNVYCPVHLCFTLSELTSDTSSYYKNRNFTTLEFLPGNHHLKKHLLLSNVPNFKMFANENSSTSIVCKPTTGFTIHGAGTVMIDGLKFIGCGHNSIIQSDNFVMWNSTFEGAGGAGTALSLNQTPDATISECIFILNGQRNDKIFIDFGVDAGHASNFNLVPNVTNKQGGGAIFVSMSSLSIENCLFSGNEAQYGGAIFAELNSSIVINNCTFYENRAVDTAIKGGVGSMCTNSSGGTIFVSDSRVEINNSLFTNNSITVHPDCYGRGGVLFAFQSKIIISNCNFTGNKMVFENAHGGVNYVSNSTLLLISNCRFSENVAHVAGVMHLQGSNGTINQCDFNSNIGFKSAGAISATQESYIEFDNCLFRSNRARTLGGALYIASSSVLVDQAYFVSNYVEEVGAVIVVFEQAHVRVCASAIIGNRAKLAVVSVHNSTVTFSSTNTLISNQGSLLAFNSTIRFQGETTFFNSTSRVTDLHDAILQEGGAISAYSSNLIFQCDTFFIRNRANYGGAIFAVESSIVFDQHSTTALHPRITIANNTAMTTGGGIHLYHSIMTIRVGHCHITDNNATEKGGGIHAIYSRVSFELQTREEDRMLVFSDNNARLGGGLHLEGTSKLIISLSNSSVIFARNTADYGGAIFVDDDTKFDTCFTTDTNITPASECFFSVLEPQEVNEADSISIERIKLYDNTARLKGSDVFGGLLDRCVPHIIASDIGSTLLTGVIAQRNTDALKKFQELSNIKNLSSITSQPTKVCFCVNEMLNCTNHIHHIQVRKGEFFNVSIVAVDQVELPTKATLFGSLSSTDGNLITGKRRRITESCTNITYSVASPSEHENITLFVDGPCRDAEISQLKVEVSFSACICPIGFKHSSDTTRCDCICDPLISQYITDCDATSATFKRKTNSWINHVIQNNQSTYIVCERCPFRYCQRPPESISIDLSNDVGSDVQCSEGHTGTICGVCSSNFSVSLAHKRCLRCPDDWYVLFIVISVGTILAGLGLVISILALNFTVAIGTINGFIFYANIVDVYDSTFLPLSTSSFPVLVIEWLNLDPGLDICFIRGIDLYGHTWVRLIFPAYIIFIVLIIIIISRHSLKFSKVIGKRNPIATLATLVYLSFTNILETAVVSLRPTTLNYITSNGSQQVIVWLPDGELKYLQGKHILLFLVALTLVFLTTIYLFLLISWQWLVRYPNVWILKWTKNQKLQSFMEAYHAPYCDQHRYWTGLLLLVRVLLILISIITEGQGSVIPLLSTICVVGTLFLLRMVYAKKLYKTWQVEVLETLLLFNLFVYALFMWFALDNLQTRMVIAYISTSVTFLLILCVVAYHAYAYAMVYAFPKFQRRMTSNVNSAHRETISNLDARDNLNQSGDEDRFHEMFSTIIPGCHLTQYQVTNNISVSPTFSVLETPYTHVQTEQEQETAITDAR